MSICWDHAPPKLTARPGVFWNSRLACRGLYGQTTEHGIPGVPPRCRERLTRLAKPRQEAGHEHCMDLAAPTRIDHRRYCYDKNIIIAQVNWNWSKGPPHFGDLGTLLARTSQQSTSALGGRDCRFQHPEKRPRKILSASAFKSK
ncbi:hypothetical protein PG991_015900 [Apiospora marii]|uniref:Uncharacterized protein n=1 Tax=Apiospora marii TaxID=335849 RepID=A0ABR1R004_9PEZI